MKLSQIKTAGVWGAMSIALVFLFQNCGSDFEAISPREEIEFASFLNEDVGDFQIVAHNADRSSTLIEGDQVELNIVQDRTHGQIYTWYAQLDSRSQLIKLGQTGFTNEDNPDGNFNWIITKFERKDTGHYWAERPAAVGDADPDGDGKIISNRVYLKHEGCGSGDEADECRLQRVFAEIKNRIENRLNNDRALRGMILSKENAAFSCLQGQTICKKNVTDTTAAGEDNPISQPIINDQISPLIALILNSDHSIYARLLGGTDPASQSAQLFNWTPRPCDPSSSSQRASIGCNLSVELKWLVEEDFNSQDRNKFPEELKFSLRINWHDPNRKTDEKNLTRSEEIIVNGNSALSSLTCPVENGIGIMLLENGSSVGQTCQVLRCTTENAKANAANTSCACPNDHSIQDFNDDGPVAKRCVPTVVPCSPGANATGTQTFDNNTYGACKFTDCINASFERIDSATDACRKKQVTSIIQCQSWKHRYAECAVPNSAKIIAVSVQTKLSKSACNGSNTFFNNGFFRQSQNASFGNNGTNMIWVNHGCRANFSVTYEPN